MSARDGCVLGGPLVLLRVEGAAVFVGAILMYAHLGLTWWVFVALILLPDASMLGYFASARTGAASYNAVHTVTAPVALLAAGFLFGSSLTLSLGAIWLAHIGLDRMLGYGLKYATGFANTHLGVLGKLQRNAL
jgi:hypothetical protein